MIQHKSRLCYGAMKLAYWPTLSLGASRLLCPAVLKGQSTTVPMYSCSSTMAQEQKSTKDEPEQKDSSKNVSKSEGRTKSVDSTSLSKDAPLGVQVKSLASDASNEASKKKKVKPPIYMKPEPRAGDLAAVMRVKSLAEAIEVCSSFNPQQCLSALKNLASDRSRPLQLIQTLSQGIHKSVTTLNVKELIDVLFCLSKLSYIDEDLLSNTCKTLKNNMDQVKSAALVGSALTSLRKLQWKDPELLEKISVWILENFNTFQNPSSFIYTLALQNYSPKNLEKLLPMVWNNATENGIHPPEVVNLIWSLFVLDSEVSQSIIHDNLEILFLPEFLEKIGKDPSTVPVWTKLCNIHAASNSLLKKKLRTNFQIPEEIRDLMSRLPNKNEKVIMVSQVKEFLFKDMDTNLYAAYVPTSMGFSIDLMFNLDDNMKAVPLELKSRLCQRVAAMVHSYHECCRPTKEPNGYRILEMKLLNNSYKVVSVPYHILEGSHEQVHKYFEVSLRSLTKKNV